MSAWVDGPLFSLGHIVFTIGALDACTDLEREASAFIGRHARGDWGELDDCDIDANNAALKNGTRLLSAYTLTNGTKLWVITEADRSATTLLLPEEY